MPLNCQLLLLNLQWWPQEHLLVQLLPGSACKSSHQLQQLLMSLAQMGSHQPCCLLTTGGHHLPQPTLTMLAQGLAGSPQQLWQLSTMQGQRQGQVLARHWTKRAQPEAQQPQEHSTRRHVSGHQTQNLAISPTTQEQTESHQQQQQLLMKRPGTPHQQRQQISTSQAQMRLQKLLPNLGCGLRDLRAASEEQQLQQLCRQSQRLLYLTLQHSLWEPLPVLARLSRGRPWRKPSKRAPGIGGCK